MPNHQDYDRPLVDNTPADSGRMWPIDLSVVTLAGLVLFLIATPFRFDDPRLLYNATTYLVTVICVALILSLALRAISSRFLRKAILLGLLFSISVHLLLLIFAIHYVVFAAYQPLASKGEKRERTPIRKTVPEHIFQSPKESVETPDWSKPVDAETVSREIPKEQRQLPPVERSQPRLEVPKPRQIETQPMQKYLMERKQASAAEPMPADSPGELAKRISNQPAPRPESKPIDAPSLAEDASRPAKASPSERPMESPAASSAARQAASQLAMSRVAPQPTLAIEPTQATPAAASRSVNEQLPTIGDAGLARARRSPSIAAPSAVAGAAPAPLVVAVARNSAEASMMLAPMDVPADRTGQTTGAQITTGQQPSFMSQSTAITPSEGTELARNDLSAAIGAPSIEAGSAERAPGRSRMANVARGASPVGSVTPAEALPASAKGSAGSAVVDQMVDRLAALDALEPSDRAESGGAPTTDFAPAGAPGMTLDLIADLGPVGISNLPATIAGLMPSAAQPEIVSMELPRDARPRRQVGGPATPAGTKIAAVESFSRRVMRTSGGTASNAPGMGGPATEEAIERGLAYLASIQNEDGSWSLQSQGDRVLLRSDTAATGLCLLAFQGAGYTHTQHQYAETVSKGIKFLLDNQRSSGNLYRSENELSDRNVMFYSHGIAALSLCEAYGMTQDRELRQGAQDALKYIMATQNRERGGWRYSPQVSSDTSVTGWMMMALKSGELSGLEVAKEAYDGIDQWLTLSSESPDRLDRYRYNPFAPDTPEQRHGRSVSPTMTAVGMLMRMYGGWSRDQIEMQSAADYLLQHPPRLGDRRRPLRDAYYWYYATQFMFHMGGDYWDRWNQFLNPLLLETQIKEGAEAGSWDPELPVPDQWSVHAGRLYVTTMNLLNLEVYYRHLPIYEETAAE